jgi:hypothetical protein
MPDDHRPTSLAGLTRLALVLAALSLLSLGAVACGSSSKPKLSSAQTKKRTCKQVEAALSDGPDPEADPVGHAQAQILPLREIHTADGALHRAIDRLAAAYQSFSSTDGSGTAKSAVSAASEKIEHLCPRLES